MASELNTRALQQVTSESTTPALLSVRNLNKTYPDGTQALHDVSLDIPSGQLVAVIGLSGAGKSTFMRCVNRLVEPTSGQIVFDGQDVTRARRGDLRRIRRQMGMIFQQFNLVQRLPVVTNVLHGRLGYTSAVRGCLGRFPQHEVEQALEMLAQVGLADQAFKRCSELSGGQMQRVGIARAMMQGAALILADEPIASLDVSSSEKVMTILKEVATAQRITTIVNLHQVDFAQQFADRVIGLRDGSVFCDMPTDGLTEDLIRDLYYGHVPQQDEED
ncbi:phosphonate ABC transporter ATP-binding protein [Phytoactinopolyspora endophytica]|uniref:phosphonate ABC transporter ATP-binding protein n=1 Tax=Phytoactinopolyspora endophytica TaxID=1642495 RepID=UPI00101BE0AB|nr:phosphonate ABC transporter ATP-binding protein [Phytoactinopolyspora endophytica]